MDYKVKLNFYFFLLLGILISQDSLFWFDMSKVRDPAPNTPLIMDRIFGLSQFTMIDSVRDIKISTIDGFRIQLYESSSAEKANKIMKKYSKTLEDSLYLVFDAPLYKIRYGNYSKKTEAEDVKKILKREGHVNTWIVKSRIEQDNVENIKKLEQ